MGLLVVLDLGILLAVDKETGVALHGMVVVRPIEKAEKATGCYLRVGVFRMNAVKPGDRVGCFMSTNTIKKIIYFLGFGLYEGDEMPAYLDDLTFEDACKSNGDGEWPEHLNTEEKRLEEFKKFKEGPLYQMPRIKPKIMLDNGDTVWGHECHYGPEAEVRKLMEKFWVQHVVLTRKENGAPGHEQMAGRA
jgi:hypothetical protein